MLQKKPITSFISISSANHCIIRMVKFACSYHFWSRKPCFRLFQKKVNSTFSLFLLEMYIREKNGIFTKIVLQSYQKRFACNLSIFDVNHSALCDLLTWYHSSTLVWRHLEVVVEYERGLRKKETLDFLFFVSNSFFFLLWWYRSALSIRLSKKLCKKVIQTIKVVVCIWNR